MKLIVITPTKDIPDESNFVTMMFEAGLPLLHLRKPSYSTAQMTDYLNEIPAHFHNRIVIHSHHKLALKYDLKGIHLTRTHLKSKFKYWWLKFRLKLRLNSLSKSRSYNKLPQAYNEEASPYDYYLIGTMFNTLNGNLNNGFFEEGVIAANRNCKKRLVARGGTNIGTIAKTRDLGFYGIAFNSCVWESDNPYEYFLRIIKTFRELHIELD